MKFKKFEDYMNEADGDFEIEKDKLSSTISKLPMMHSKWMRYYYEENMILIKKEKELSEMYIKKYEFYKTGYNLEVPANKMDYFINGDKEYSGALLKLNAHKKMVDYLESTVNRCQNQNFIIKNLIEWEKFKAGF